MSRLLDETRTAGTAVVLGAGTMGGGIAADLANAGWDVRLLDVTEEAAVAGRERIAASRPPLLFLPDYLDRIRADAMARADTHLRAADWVVEAVAERMDAKQDVLSRVAAVIPAHTIVTSNTSGLGLAAMSAHLPADVRRRFLGSHFLNPPRYLKLLEVIPTPETDPDITAGFVRFAEQVLGHRVVLARDTPGFISTRLWIAHLMDTLHAAEEHHIDAETADYLTGPLLGRPKSATFRMADLVGLDIVAAIAANQREALPTDPLRDRLFPPPALRALLAAGHTGEKAGGGFYRREGKTILTFDLATGDYRPRRCDIALPAVEAAAHLPLPARLRALAATAERDAPWSRFLNGILDTLTGYVRAVGPEIATDTLSVDRTMQWGFGWELGPFALDDARRAASNHYAGTPPRRTYRAFGTTPWQPWPDEPEYRTLDDLAAPNTTLHATNHGTLYDLGDGVWCAALHTKMNTFDPGLCAFLQDAVRRAEAARVALVLTGRGPHFSAGYDLKRLASLIERGDLVGIDAEMKLCQDTFQALRRARVPVVAAVHGFTLGAGCECALHTAAVVAAPETVFGLPELSVGLLPCGGGIKETLRRCLERDPDPLAAARAALRTLALPPPAANAHEALRDGRLRPPADAVCRNPDRLLHEAARRARHLAAASGYPPPPLDQLPVTGAPGLAHLRQDIAAAHSEGALTDYDAHIAERIARVLCGGEDTAPGPASEQRLLDTERAAFLELCPDPRTLARIRHLLETGKHLRN